MMARASKYSSLLNVLSIDSLNVLMYCDCDERKRTSKS